MKPIKTLHHPPFSQFISFTTTATSGPTQPHNAQQHFRTQTPFSLRMNAPTIDTSSSIFVDMYIGPVFDAERYLELERELFKVEPRPIPGCERSAARENSKSSLFDKFISGATKFSCWLDEVLKAPFRAISSMTNSLLNQRSESVNGVTPKTEARPIKPPPKAYKPKSKESRPVSQVDASGSAMGNEEPKGAKKVAVAETSQKKLNVIRGGHVQKLIRKFEELSDVSGESSVGQTRTQPRSATSSLQPGRNGKNIPVPIAWQGYVKHGGSGGQKPKIPKVVTMPARVAPASMLVTRRNGKRGAIASVRSVSLSMEDNAAEVGDTNKLRSGGNVAHDNVGYGGRACKTVEV